MTPSPWNSGKKRQPDRPGARLPGRPLGRPWGRFSLIAIALLALIAFLAWSFPYAAERSETWGQVVSRIAILLLVGSGVVGLLAHRPLAAFRHLAIWFLLGGFLFAGYTFREDARYVGNRLLAELVPGMAGSTGEAVTIAAGRDGHFHVLAEVDGQRIRFLVDTGASDIILTKADARRLGFDPDALAYTRRYRTANGTVMAAPVQLGSVTIGTIGRDNLRASVNQGELSTSLLGMSFLEKLGGYAVEQGRLVLYP